MRLAEFIRRNREKIISEWVTFARSLLPPGRSASTKALRDHAAGILDAIARDMDRYQSSETQTAKAQGRGESSSLGGAGKHHAIKRIATGFRLDQLVAEYRALRASVLRLWGESAPHEIDPNEVTRFNEAIDETLTESTNRYMEMLDRHRNEFVGILGHDLRNPLSAIVMGASVLVATEGLDERSARIAARVLTSARRMDRLVGDLLDLTRTRLGAGIPIVRSSVDLARVCRQVITELRGAHPDAVLHFEVKGELLGKWDGDRLAQVVSNLVGNALQHGQQGRPITIAARRERNDVVLEVHNEGPPIPRHALGTIFEPMARVGPARKDHSKSLGLGLYVAEQVVRAHGGTVEVTSSKAHGTTFTVRLPRTAHAERSVNLMDAEPTREVEVITPSRKVPRPAPRPRATARARRATPRKVRPPPTRGTPTAPRTRSR